MNTSYLINGKDIKIKPHIFEGKQSLEVYENQILISLSKIGLTKDYIEIETNENFARVIWQINKKKYQFKCDSQKTVEQNLGAIAQAIQEDIRQITRGIKNLYQIMNQYEEKVNIKSKLGLFNYSNGERDSLDMFSNEKNSLLYIDDENLDKNFEYLLKFPPQRLELLYLKLKDECAKKNNPNHPTFKALKIIRKKRGLKL